MNITDLIEKLQEIKEKHGDIKVAVQYRDEGGDYYGCETELYLDVKECGPGAYKYYSDDMKEGEKFLLL